MTEAEFMTMLNDLKKGSKIWVSKTIKKVTM
jgi:hypothetical protein